MRVAALVVAAPRVAPEVKVDRVDRADRADRVVPASVVAVAVAQAAPGDRVAQVAAPPRRKGRHRAVAEAAAADSSATQ